MKRSQDERGSDSMDEQDPSSGGIKVVDALNLYFTEVGFPDSICDELRSRIIDGLKISGDLGGGISLSNYCLEVYESGSEYYVDDVAFKYVIQQIRLKGLSGHSCRQPSEIDDDNKEGT